MNLLFCFDGMNMYQWNFETLGVMNDTPATEIPKHGKYVNICPMEKAVVMKAIVLKSTFVCF